MFYNNIHIDNNDNKSLIKKIVDKILNYFNNYFYSQKIINKLKKRIFLTIIRILKNLLFEQIEIKLKEIKSNNNTNIKNNELNTNLIEINLNEKYINELKLYLFEKKINIENNELKKNIIKINIIENIFEVLSDMDKWLEKEIKIIENTDKKVLKELDKKNISSNYNNLQRYLLSFSVKNNWEIIKKIRTIENYHQKINNKKDNNINNSSSLRQSINIFTVNNDLDNLNNFYNEDLNNFGNIDYFGEQNNDLNNNNFTDINNNNNNDNNFLSGLNNLKSSNFFFG